MTDQRGWAQMWFPHIHIITSPFNITYRLLWAINAHASKGRRGSRLFALRYSIVSGRREREGEMVHLKAHERQRKELLNRMRESISWPSVLLLLLLPISLKSRQDCVYVAVFPMIWTGLGEKTGLLLWYLTELHFIEFRAQRPCRFTLKVRTFINPGFAVLYLLIKYF